jgi:hypothetical protein
MAQYFNGPRPIGQFTDIAAFLQSGYQPVDTGFTGQPNRLTHFIIRWGYIVFRLMLYQKAQKLMLFFG